MTEHSQLRSGKAFVSSLPTQLTSAFSACDTRSGRYTEIRLRSTPHTTELLLSFYGATPVPDLLYPSVTTAYVSTEFPVCRGERLAVIERRTS
eukprot:scaffold3474_cov246-Pinguiococcus_pyrenoidosus.AAC.3